MNAGQSLLWGCAAAVWLAVPGSAGCDRDVELAPAQETPSRQFIISGMQLEERRDGQVLWTGRAERADGDMQTTDVTDVVLTRLPQKPSETAYTVRAPAGVLELKQGQATFDNVTITDDAGATLTAPRALYSEEAAAIEAAGPLQFLAQGMTAHAESALLHLDDGIVDVRGPVVGRYTPPDRGLKKK